MVEWSPPTKARLTVYAGEVAGEFGVPEGDRDEFLSASSVSFLFFGMKRAKPALTASDPQALDRCSCGNPRISSRCFERHQASGISRVCWVQGMSLLF